MSYNNHRHGETMNKDETLEALHNFWNKVDPETAIKAYTWSYQISANLRQVLSQAACHASFTEIKEPHWISSMFFTYQANEPIADTMWDWVTSKESPWYRILKNCEEVKNKHGVRVAWLISGDVAKTVPFNYIKNLAISMRILSEHLPAARFWKIAVDAGIHPTEAYFLSTYYTASDRNIISYSTGRSAGGHWGLTENHTNLKILKQGLYDRPGHGINAGWLGGTERATVPSDFPKQGEVIYTKFSQINGINIRTIKNRLEEWKKEKKID